MERKNSLMSRWSFSSLSSSLLLIITGFVIVSCETKHSFTSDTVSGDQNEDKLETETSLFEAPTENNSVPNKEPVSDPEKEKQPEPEPVPDPNPKPDPEPQECSEKHPVIASKENKVMNILMDIDCSGSMLDEQLALKEGSTAMYDDIFLNKSYIEEGFRFNLASIGNNRVYGAAGMEFVSAVDLNLSADDYFRAMQSQRDSFLSSILYGTRCSGYEKMFASARTFMHNANAHSANFDLKVVNPFYKEGRIITLALTDEDNEKIDDSPDQMRDSMNRVHKEVNGEMTDTSSLVGFLTYKLKGQTVEPIPYVTAKHIVSLIETLGGRGVLAQLSSKGSFYSSALKSLITSQIKSFSKYKLQCENKLGSTIEVRLNHDDYGINRKLVEDKDYQIVESTIVLLQPILDWIDNQAKLGRAHGYFLSISIKE